MEDHPLLLDISGQTKFHLGNVETPIEVKITIGYRSRYVKEEENKEGTEIEKDDQKKTEKFLYASLTTIKEDGISIGDLIKSCTENYNETDIPDILKSVSFKHFSVNYGTKGFESNDLIIEFACDITIKENHFKAKISIAYNKDKNDKISFKFSGILKVDDHQFEIKFNKENTLWYLYAQYQNTGKVEINFKQLAGRFFDEKTREKLPELSLNLADFNAFFLYKKGKDKDDKDVSGILFGMGAGMDLDLENLPLAGPIMAGDKAFAFKEVLAIYANGKFEKTEFKGKDFDGIPDVDIAEGFNIATKLQINGKDSVYVLNSGTGQSFNDRISLQNANVQQDVQQATLEKNDKKDSSTKEEKDSKVLSLSGSVSEKAKWLKLDKKIGPVTLNRIGFNFNSGKVILLLDASIEMLGMGMQLMGFGLGFKLEWKLPPSIPDFYLDGLGLSFKSPPIEISGAFLRSTTEYKGENIDVYNGGAILKLANFSLSAIGSYAATETPSLFIYGVFDGTIGGPAFFFVTGIAAGFGFNRKVNVPDISEVAEFPLVALAMQPVEPAKGTGLLKILKDLQTPMKSGKVPIEISIGDYWLAIGIKFTTFKVLESFVLLTVNFGTQLEFTILGLSRLTLYQKPMPSPIAYIEMAILAHFGPSSDTISVEGIITPNSYILTKDCKLSGGFAFYAWIKGVNEGDFVITVGGYHPKFIKPSHYPTVPRMALNWKVNDSLSISGEMYFALTPSCVMLGGKWEILFKSAVVSASMVLWVDILISWAPVHYELDIGIIIKIGLNLKILFVQVHYSLELHAQIQIWGPPFQGRAYIDCTIFSFTILFGAQEKHEPKPLKWIDFSKEFIPKKKSNNSLSASSDDSLDIGSETASITISNGLMEVKGEDKLPIVNPLQLAIVIDSFIPISILKFNKDNEIDGGTLMKSQVGDLTYENRNKSISVKPCGFKEGVVSFEMNVDIKFNDADFKDLTKINVYCTSKGFADALWGVKKNEQVIPKADEQVITNVLSGLVIQPSPLKDKAEGTKLTIELDPILKTFDWNFELAKSGEAYHSDAILEYFHLPGEKPETENYKKTYGELKEERKELIEKLKGFDASFGNFEETATFNNNTSEDHYFRGTPVVCEMGRIPQYNTDTK